jgi:enterochelin esterase-like enzyme
MKAAYLAFYRRYLSERHSSVILFFISLLIALLSGLLLFNDTLIGGLVSTIIAIGLDPLRAQLIASLVMTAGTALIGAVWVRRRLGAIVGAGIVFWFAYLADFIRLEQQPTHDPAGNLEVLNTGALIHTSFTMTALALLSAFIGSAVGVALSEVLLEPLHQLVQTFWRNFRHGGSSLVNDKGIEHRLSHPRTAVNVIASWLGAVVMVILLVFASDSGSLFIYSPDIGLHTPPTIHNRAGLPAHGTIVEDSVISPALGGQKKPFLVYLPPSYNTPQGRTKRYPTLFLLHGSPGSDHDWFTAGKADQSADTLIALGKIPELIMILPDGNGRRGQTSEWGNSFDKHQLIEKYVAVDLIKYVDSRYRTIAEPAFRGIGGLSMGGFGAMNIAIHHPDVFGFVISLGGYYHAEGSIWGNNAAYIRVNSPADVLPGDKQAWKLHMFIGAATKDEPYYTYSMQFVQELKRLQIPYQLDIQAGYHSWKVWQVQLYDALLWLHWG